MRKPLKWLNNKDVFIYPISGAMGEGMGMGDPPTPPPEPPPSPPPSPPPPPPSPAGAIRGSLWVQSATLSFIDENGFKLARTGTSISTPPSAVVGALFAEADAASKVTLTYIDASGAKRRLAYGADISKPLATVVGSLWVQGGNLRWTRASGLVVAG